MHSSPTPPVSHTGGFFAWTRVRLDLSGDAVAVETALYDDYRRWVEGQGGVHFPLGAPHFGNVLTAAGIGFAGQDSVGRRLRRGAQIKAAAKADRGLRLVGGGA